MSALQINLNLTQETEKVKMSVSEKKQKDAIEEDLVGGGRPPPSANHNKPTRHGPGGEDINSSLFAHNPSIPKMIPQDFEPTKESVFSLKTFDQLSIEPRMVKNLADLGITTLTTIQSKALPIIMAEKDALIKSQTGSGKTLTYALPILQKLSEKVPRVERADGCYALVIVPTRELALQSYEWFQKLCRTFIWLVPGLLVGGEGRKAEKARLRKGVNILVSTPGRLVDHIDKTEAFSLANVEWVVLDEADRMLELGYEREVRKVLDALQKTNTKKRQSLLLSATLTQGIEQLSEVSLRHPVYVDAAEDEGEEGKKNLVTPENLKQTFLLVPAKLRLVALGAFVLWKCAQAKNSKKMLIFLATQDMVDFYTRYLEVIALGEEDDEEEEDEEEEEETDKLTHDARLLGDTLKVQKKDKKPKKAPRRGLAEGLELLKLHGNMTQKDRMSVFNHFRAASSGVLLCTDVAARGLDLPMVDWIVQFNAPISTADYVHRVGRTARIGAKGSSVIFLLPSEAGFVRELEKDKIPLLEMTLEMVLDKLQKSGISNTSTGLRASTMEEAATSLQIRIEQAITHDNTLHELACQAYVSFVRSYASYPKEVRDVFCFKALHLGHCAKSFGLRDPPSRITGIGKGQWTRKQERKDLDLKREGKIIKAQKRRINEKGLIVSEFSSGLQGIEHQAREAKRVKKEKSRIKK